MRASLFPRRFGLQSSAGDYAALKEKSKTSLKDWYTVAVIRASGVSGAQKTTPTKLLHDCQSPSHAQSIGMTWYRRIFIWQLAGQFAKLPNLIPHQNFVCSNFCVCNPFNRKENGAIYWWCIVFFFLYFWYTNNWPRTIYILSHRILCAPVSAVLSLVEGWAQLWSELH